MKIAKSELLLRVCSALVLAPLALAAAYYGRWPFALFWSGAAVGTLYEWNTLIGRQQRVLLVGLPVLAVALGLGATQHVPAALMLIVVGSLATAILAAQGKRIWIAAGFLYAGSLGIAPMLLRSDVEFGLLALIFLFAVVWATDTTAYAAGKAIAGPKLMARVSPKKTWAGALGGTVGAILAALVVAELTGLSALTTAVLAAILSILAQAGDLFESFLKRRFGAKDSGGLIPGHGGLMDRLDGFVAASFAAAVIGLLRGGLAAPGRGLLVW